MHVTLYCRDFLNCEFRSDLYIFSTKLILLIVKFIYNACHVNGLSSMQRTAKQAKADKYRKLCRSIIWSTILLLKVAYCIAMGVWLRSRRRNKRIKTNLWWWKCKQGLRVKCPIGWWRIAFWSIVYFLVCSRAGDNDGIIFNLATTPLYFF